MQVPAAIAQCQCAGITVRLVTGDSLSTAKFVAYKCGILRQRSSCSDNNNDEQQQQQQQEELAIEGREFNKLIRPEPGHPVRN